MVSMGAEAERAAVRKPIQFRSYDEQERLELTPPLDLRLRYERLSREFRLIPSASWCPPAPRPWSSS